MFAVNFILGLFDTRIPGTEGLLTHIVKLDKGAYATVYSATYQGQKVAVKVYTVDWRNNCLDSAEKITALCAAEVAIMQKIPQHPRLIKLTACIANGFIMDFMPNKNLRGYMKNCPYDHRMRIAEEIAEGLAELHQADIVHCDLKPANIFVDMDGTIKIGDFGLAQELKGASAIDSRMGALRYMSPELFFEQRASKASDMYAFALILWELHANLEFWPHLREMDQFADELRRKNRPYFSDLPISNAACALIAFGLWRENPGARHSAAQAFAHLKKMNLRQQGLSVRPPSLIHEINENQLWVNPQLCLMQAVHDSKS